jgi:hypothetical protein
MKGTFLSTNKRAHWDNRDGKLRDILSLLQASTRHRTAPGNACGTSILNNSHTNQDPEIKRTLKSRVATRHLQPHTQNKILSWQVVARLPTNICMLVVPSLYTGTTTTLELYST